MDISVIIVSYNAEKFIGPCIESVIKSLKKMSGEIIVIDNGSTDKSLEKIEEIAKRAGLLHFVRNDINKGSCGARNQGAKKARGKYLIFLDCDTQVDKNCFSEYVKTFEKDKKIGAIHGKLLKMDDKKTFDSSGELFDGMGFLADRGKDDSNGFIASGKAASYAIRKDLFDKLGGYDKDFFFFVEEPDLDMRVWLSGFKVVFSKEAICYHAFGTNLKDTKNYYSKYLVRYYGARNYLLMHLKNQGMKRLFKILPLMILSLGGLAFVFILRGKIRDGFYILKGIFWNVLNIQTVWKKRRFVQDKIRKVKDNEIDFLFLPRRSFGSYLTKVKSYLGNELK